MKSIAGFHFVIDRGGAPAFLDPNASIAFRRAEGDFVAPDRAQATVRVVGPGLVAEVALVSIGDRYWETHPLSGAWQELPPEFGFNPATLFDPQIGLQPILESDLRDLESRGIADLEEIPGERFYHVSGRVLGERLYQLSFGLIGPGPMEIQLWIGPRTFELHRMHITEAGVDGGEPTIWQVDLWDFDHVIEITPPPVEGSGGS